MCLVLQPLRHWSAYPQSVDASSFILSCTLALVCQYFESEWRHSFSVYSSQVFAPKPGRWTSLLNSYVFTRPSIVVALTTVLGGDTSPLPPECHEYHAVADHVMELQYIQPISSSKSSEVIANTYEHDIMHHRREFNNRGSPAFSGENAPIRCWGRVPSLKTFGMRQGMTISWNEYIFESRSR